LDVDDSETELYKQVLSFFSKNFLDRINWIYKILFTFPPFRTKGRKRNPLSAEEKVEQIGFHHFHPESGETKKIHEILSILSNINFPITFCL